LDENMLTNKLPSIKLETGSRKMENPLLGEYDLIIGSDVLYEAAHAEQVPRFIHDDFRIDVNVIIVDPD